MGYLGGFLVTLRQHRLFGGDRVTTSYSGGRVARKKARKSGDSGADTAAHDNDITGDEKIPKPERLHGRHVLNRYEDGMEKCIGCELCAGVCPAKCIYVRGADNDPVDPTSPGERFGFVYEINYLRCIHCDMCVEACPTEAITESKLFEFSFTNRRDAIYTKAELVVVRRRQAEAPAVGGLARRRRRAHQRLDAGHLAVRRGRVRRRGRLERRARLRRPTPRAEGARRPHRADGAALMELVVFVIAAAMILGGAVGVIVRTHPVHCALSLILTLFGIAVLFIEQNAQFLAAVQVIVYAGAIVVLFLFVIMLLGVDDVDDLRIEPFKIQRPLAAVVCVAIVGLVITAVVTARNAIVTAPPVSAAVADAEAVSAHDGNIRALARDLFSNHVFAFELTSVLLVIAVVGTVLLSRRLPKAPGQDVVR